MNSNIASLLAVKENLAGMQLMRGRIISFSRGGEIIIEDEHGSRRLICDFLRTSSAPLPVLNKGDLVLYALDESLDRGYVIGVIQGYGNTNETPDTLKIKAGEKIELHCGKSTLTMDKEGKVVVKGRKIVSRASGVNKIKGAAVKIN